MRRQLSMATRHELIKAVTARYRAGTRSEKKQSLGEFVEVTGFHRKHAIRALKKAAGKREKEFCRQSRELGSMTRQSGTH
jgi:hypothetical protein